MTSKKDEALRALYEEIADSIAEAPDAEIVEECKAEGNPSSRWLTTCATYFVAHGRDFNKNLFAKLVRSISARR
jgi:hypothetical protein